MKAYFPFTILGSPLCPAESVKNLVIWFDSCFFLVYMFRMSAKVILWNSVTLDKSGTFLLFFHVYTQSVYLTNGCGQVFEAEGSREYR